MTLADVLLAHLDSAEARFEAARVSALYEYETSLRSAGADADEVAARVDRYANDLVEWRDKAVLSVADALKDFMVKVRGSTVDIEGQGCTRH